MPVRVPFVDCARDLGIISRAWNNYLQPDTFIVGLVLPAVSF